MGPRVCVCSSSLLYRSRRILRFCRKQTSYPSLSCPITVPVVSDTAANHNAPVTPYDLLRKTPGPDNPPREATTAPFAWTAAYFQVFEGLKEAFCSAPILRYLDSALQTIVEPDASDFAAVGVLSQRFPEGDSFVLHPVAY
jgi:hypothetical protein